MKSLLLALILSTSALAASAQDTPVADAGKAAPSTKLEAFSARTGIVLIKGFTTLGTINGLGRVTIDAREFRDASNPKQAQYGVTFEVKESGRLERENTSFVDEDEIDSLLRGLDYIAKINKGVTTLSSFEAQYRTKGDFALTVFSGRGGEISLAVSSGRIGRTSAYLKLSDGEQIRRLLMEAKNVIAAAKQAAR
jgi:hypothetical protein